MIINVFCADAGTAKSIKASPAIGPSDEPSRLCSIGNDTTTPF
jgi:hypothetical protein